MLPKLMEPVDMTIFYPPNDPPNDGRDTAFTFESVQARLVEAVRCWWRMPGGGYWPFASDGPWHLIRLAAGDYDVGYDKDGKPVKLAVREGDAPLRPLPLRSAEVSEMEAVTEWLLLIGEDDRRVVVLALQWLARGEKRVPWARMLEPLGVCHGAGGLARRYERAIGVLSLRLSGLSEARARRMVYGAARGDSAKQEGDA